MLKMEIDNNYKLIKEVEKYPLLYNFHLAEYSSKDKTVKTWGEIAKTLDSSVTDVKERWRNIRSSYIRSKKPRKTGSGSRLKKTYYLAEYLAFIEPYLKPFRNVSRSNGEANQGDDNETGTDDQSEDSSGDEDVESFIVTRGNKRKRSNTDMDRTPQNSNKQEVFREYQDVPSSSSLHPMHYFFMSLLGDFDDMTQSQMRHFKIKVLELINNIKLEQEIDNPFIDVKCNPIV